MVRRPSARRRTSTPAPARGGRGRPGGPMQCRGVASPGYRNHQMTADVPRSTSPRSPPSTGSRRSGAPAGRPTAPTASTAPTTRDRDLLHRHAAADGERLAARRPRLLATPTPTPSPASSACGAARSSTRWAGTTTACPPSAGCRTTSASAATRRSPTTPTSRRPTEPPKPAGRHLPAQLRRAVRPADRRGREGLRGAVAPPRPVGRLVA